MAGQSLFRFDLRPERDWLLIWGPQAPEARGDENLTFQRQEWSDKFVGNFGLVGHSAQLIKHENAQKVSPDFSHFHPTREKFYSINFATHENALFGADVRDFRCRRP